MYRKIKYRQSALWKLVKLIDHELDLISKRERQTRRLRLTWRTSVEEESSIRYGVWYY
jgi:hypothetical protein